MSQSNHQLLDILTREGVLIKLSIHYWRGSKKLKPEDVGLDPENIPDRLISLGQKRLLPKEATSTLSQIESRSHAFLEANTFPFLNGLAHFIPNAKLEEVTSRLNQLETEFNQAKIAFLNHYAKNQDQAQEDWLKVGQKLGLDPEHLLATLKASYPPQEILERKFSFETNLFQISVPQNLGLDLVDLADQKKLISVREEAAQNAALQIRAQTQSFLSDCIASLREQTAKLCEEMLNSIRTSEKGVHQKTLNRLVKFIDQFKAMNFVDDKAMESQLEEAKNQLLSKTAEQYRDSKFASQQLEQGLEKLAAHARQLADEDTKELVKRFGELGKRKFHLAA